MSPAIAALTVTLVSSFGASSAEGVLKRRPNLEGALGPACCLVLRDRRGPCAAFRRLSPDLENCTDGQKIELSVPEAMTTPFGETRSPSRY